MSALFISDRWPRPLAAFRHGTAQRMRLLMRALQQACGGPLHLLLLAPHGTRWGLAEADALRGDFARLWDVQVGEIRVEVDPKPPQPVMHDLWRGYLRPATSLYRQWTYARMSSAALQDALHDVLSQTRPTLVFAHRLPAMALLRRSGRPTPPVAFDLDDIESKAFARAVALPPVWRSKRLQLLQVPALRRMEDWAIRRAALTLVCSDADARELNARCHSTRVAAVANAVPTPTVSALPDQPSVLFLGVHTYGPNRSGAEWLIQQVWPRVRQRCPQAQLRIAGKDCERIAGFAAPPPGVEFLGFVLDLAALYAQTRVVACPIHSGGGTRIKIVEGALQQRPIVSTTLGAEGLVFSAERGEIVLADAAADFADALCALLDDPGRCLRLGEAARRCAMQHYDESRVTADAAEKIRAALP
ncbi:MAG: glycosyltransferase [Burkholderiaceae bacterium]|nr:glycosyltransferase [Burkholderiaceae bacterium]